MKYLLKRKLLKTTNMKSAGMGYPSSYINDAALYIEAYELPRGMIEEVLEVLDETKGKLMEIEKKHFEPWCEHEKV